MASSDDVKVITFWASPYGLRAEFALAAKGVPFQQLLEVDHWYNKSKLLVESNPIYKQIPVLLHNGKPLPESFIIIEYVDHTWPSPHGKDLLPADPFDRAMARFWSDYVEKKVPHTWLCAVEGRAEGTAGPSLHKKFSTNEHYNSHFVEYVNIVSFCRGGMVHFWLLDVETHDVEYYRKTEDNGRLSKTFCDVGSSVPSQLNAALRTVLQSKGEVQKAAVEEVMSSIATLEGVLEKAPQGGPFFGGDHVGMVDVVLGPLSLWFPAYEVIGDFKFQLEERFPRLHTWSQAMKTSPCAPCFPNPENLMEFVLNLRKMLVPN